MTAMKARVKDGHIVVDEPTSLPEGAELYVVAVPDPDALADDERAELDAAIDEGFEDLRAGRMIDGEAYLADLRSRR